MTNNFNSSSAYGKSLVVRANVGTIYGFHGYNSGADAYIQLFDSATLPADGGVPYGGGCIYAPSGQAFSFNAPQGVPCYSGITLVASTSDTTKVLIGTDTVIFGASYRPIV